MYRLPKFVYHKSLDPRVWNTDESINMLVYNALMMVVWGFVGYLQQNGFQIADSDVYDIQLHGSSTNYYYDDGSDLDVMLVIDFDKLKNFSGANIPLFLKALFASYKKHYRINIVGRGVDFTFYDVKENVFGQDFYKCGSAYSLKNEIWLRKPLRMSDLEVRKMKKQAYKMYRKYAKMYKRIVKSDMGEAYMETFLRRIVRERVNSLKENYLQPVTVETMAFRLLRSAGILRDLHKRCRKIRSKNFNIS